MTANADANSEDGLSRKIHIHKTDYILNIFQAIILQPLGFDISFF